MPFTPPKAAAAGLAESGIGVGVGVGVGEGVGAAEAEDDALEDGAAVGLDDAEVEGTDDLPPPPPPQPANNAKATIP